MTLVAVTCFRFEHHAQRLRIRDNRPRHDDRDAPEIRGSLRTYRRNAGRRAPGRAVASRRSRRGERERSRCKWKRFIFVPLYRRRRTD
jgi:hypothetical protein